MIERECHGDNGRTPSFTATLGRMAATQGRGGCHELVPPDVDHDHGRDHAR